MLRFIICGVLDHRLRSFVGFVVAIGVAIAVLAALPGARLSVHDELCGSYSSIVEPLDCYELLGLEEHRGSGLYLLIPLALALAPAVGIARRPRREAAWAWFAWAVTCAAVAAGLFFAHGHRASFFVHTEVLWPRHAVITGVTALLALFLVVLPAILVATPPPPAMPDARVVR
jgi:hypothetical protein